MRDRVGALTSISDANNLNARALTPFSPIRCEISLIGAFPIYIYIYIYGILSNENCSHGVTVRTFVWGPTGGPILGWDQWGLKDIWDHPKYQVWPQSHDPNPFINGRQAQSIPMGI